MAIKVKEAPVKVHNSVKKVERYYMPLCRVYEIISLELKDGLVPILLVFGAYP
jgi:hypothetical protein